MNLLIKEMKKAAILSLMSLSFYGCFKLQSPINGVLNSSNTSFATSADEGNNQNSNNGQGGNTSQQNVNLRVVHLSPDAGLVDVYVDNALTLEDVPYLDSSGYLPLNSSSLTARVNVANTNTVAIPNTPLNLPGEKNTLVALTDANGGFKAILLEDNAQPTFGLAQVRVIHGAPSVGAVDVYVVPPSSDCNDLSSASRQPALVNRAYESVSPYLPVPAGIYDLCVTVSGSTTAAIVGDNVILDSGNVLTVFAVETTPGLDFYILNDNQ